MRLHLDVSLLTVGKATSRAPSDLNSGYYSSNSSINNLQQWHPIFVPSCVEMYRDLTGGIIITTALSVTIIQPGLEKAMAFGWHQVSEPGPKPKPQLISVLSNTKQHQKAQNGRNIPLQVYPWDNLSVWFWQKLETSSSCKSSKWNHWTISRWGPLAHTTQKSTCTLYSYPSSFWGVLYPMGYSESCPLIRPLSATRQCPMVPARQCRGRKGTQGEESHFPSAVHSQAFIGCLHMCGH